MTPAKRADQDFRLDAGADLGITATPMGEMVPPNVGEFVVIPHEEPTADGQREDRHEM